MRKFVVMVALLILIFGVACLLTSETRFEEEVVDEWNPDPFKLYPKWNGHNESDYTGSFFVERARGNNKIFRQLFDDGKIPELSLEIYVDASGDVNVKVGMLLYPFFNETTGETFFSKVFFDTTGKLINETVKIDMTGTYKTREWRFYWLEIRNVEGDFVNISGYVRLKAEIPKTFYPFQGVGTLICLLGSSLMIYGILIKRQSS